MRPAVKRRLVTLAAAGSLVLCVATVSLWVRSYWAADRIERYDKVGSMTLGSRDGALGFWRDSDWSGATRGIYYRKVESEWPFSGTMTFSAHVRYGTQLRVILPHWVLALLFAMLSAFCFRSAVRSRRRHREGRCPACGYDVRATPDRCPECGAMPAAAAPPAAR
jgi:hypothetical protein